MDTHSATLLRDHLTLFEQSVSGTARHLSAPPDSGTWCASAPFREKCHVRELLHSTQIMPEEHTALLHEYRRIARDLVFLIEDQRYRDILYAELQELVHRYHAETCFSSLCCESGTADTRRLNREVIGELVLQLNRHYSLTALEAFIATVDENAALADTTGSKKISLSGVRSKKCLHACCSSSDATSCNVSRPSVFHV